MVTKNPSDDVKKTLAIAYYLEKFDGYSVFNAGDLLKAYQRAKEKKPLNINDKINLNIKNSHMDEAPEKKNGKKAWYLTTSGERFVENDFKSTK